MTTIAVSADGRTIAADGLATTQWGLVLSRTQCKIKTYDEWVYAIAGAYAAFEALIKWHHEGANPLNLPPTPETEPWTLLVRDLAGTWVLFSRAMPYPHDITLPFAIGAGAEMAIGAMEAGASPREAIEIVCRRSTSSGGKIVVEEL